MNIEVKHSTETMARAESLRKMLNDMDAGIYEAELRQYQGVSMDIPLEARLKALEKVLSNPTRNHIINAIARVFDRSLPAIVIHTGHPSQGIKQWTTNTQKTI